MSVTLQSSDKQDFSVSMEVARQSKFVKNIIDTRKDAESPIVLEEVTGDVLAKIIEYCEHHKNNPLVNDDEHEVEPQRSDNILPWDKQFMEVDQDMLFKIMLASKNMDIKPLLDLGCKTVANMIRGKSAEQIRTMFDITDEFTDEEKEQSLKENEWAEAHKKD
ncbi:hypothetical protein LPJ62_004562 [Coemansia sp. RSA 2167]|nr:hypothetical protein LPJ62_004562 [Coemansia sp. RSA 2167]KAJ2151433.1 hypothetical protein J3F82_003344 [Coemansia sp. RSA 637]KAJ2441924.1 hypothetical protein IWW46_003277 [Coemansia sp. RSA 2440]